MKSRVLTRREFIKSSSVATAAGALYISMPVKFLPADEKKSRVVLVRHKEVLNTLNKVNENIIQEMLDEAVTTLLDIADPVKAWKTLVKPDDVVGIKTNVWSYLPTPAALENSIKKRIMNAGVPENKIRIRDRGLLSDEIFKNATALVNVRPMRTHYWSGVGSLIKNYIMFVRDPSAWHNDTCADLAKIWNLPVVKGKTRLNILVMLTPLFYGSGPHHFNPNYTWKYNGLLVGLDPVAVDSTGVRILQAKRNEFFGEETPVNPPPHHIVYAETRYGLGIADPARIELIKLGWQENSLV